MKKNARTSKNLDPIFIGLGYFSSRPYLWWKTIFVVVPCWAILFFIFTLVSFDQWQSPENVLQNDSLMNSLNAFALANIVILLIWSFLTPLLINYLFEKLISRVYLELQITFKIMDYWHFFHAMWVLFLATAFWRIFWPALAFVALRIFSPLSLAISQFGLGHIGALDASILATILLGYSTKDCRVLIKKFRFSILLIGLSSGMMSVFLLTTIMGWIFWLPGMYIGVALFWKRKLNGFSLKETNKKPLRFPTPDSYFPS